ncbi:hypothetical protein Ddc_07486 [Ditylenchus destructor]|nr:hypothetical protein Ddc_07486 [Ditylenchus destructor]
MDSNLPTNINSAEQIPSMRLKEYELSLEIHLRKILTEMEDQQTNMNRILKEEKNKEELLAHESAKLKREANFLKRKLSNMQETPAGRIQASDLGKLKLIKEDEENQLKIYQEEVEQLAQKEKEMRKQLDLVNQEVNRITVSMDNVAWPERNDVELLKATLNKAVAAVKANARNKRVQDAYIDRLKKDVLLAETQLGKLAEMTQIVKIQESDDHRRYINLANRLRAFELHPSHDFWQELIKSLRSGQNKISLMNGDHTENKQQDDSSEKSRPTSPLFKSSTLSIGYANLEEAYSRAQLDEIYQKEAIEQRETLNAKIRQLLNRHSRVIIPQLETEIENKAKENGEISQKADELTQKYNQRRMDIGLDIVEGQHEQQLVKLETIEREAMVAEKQIALYEDILNIMDQISSARSLKDSKREHHETSDKITSNFDPKFESEMATYSKMCTNTTHLTRKKIALEHKRERLEEKITEIKDRYKGVRESTELLARELKQLDTQYGNKLATITHPPDELAPTSKEQVKLQMEGRADELNIKMHKIESEIHSLKSELEAIRAKCQEWKLKTGNFQQLRNAAEDSVSMLSEIHSLQKTHQSLEQKLWKVQKELEFTVMHRDYAVNKAHTVLGTHNQTRSQRTEINNELRMQIQVLEKEIQEKRNTMKVVNSDNPESNKRA